MASPETRLQNQCIKAIHEGWPGCFAYHPVGSPYQRKGLPDLVCCVEGIFIGIELKARRPGESVEHMLSRVTPTQRAVIDDILKAGGMAGVASTVEEALDIVRRAVEHRGRPGTREDWSARILTDKNRNKES